MIIDWFRGVAKKDDIDADKYNGVWNRLVSWWNDHDRGVRSWTNLVATIFTATTATITNLTVTAFTLIGDLTLTGNLIFNPTTKGVKGTTTNDNTTAGNVGEYIESVVGSTNFPTTGQWGDATSISLTAGDWDVTCLYNSNVNSGVTTDIELGISTTTGNSASGLIQGSNRLAQTVISGLGVDAMALPVFRMSLASTTIVYFKFMATYASGTPAISGGRISARRIR